MMGIIGIHLALLCVVNVSGFQFRSRSRCIVKSGMRKSYRSHDVVVAINTPLRSSFSDLSGRDDQDDKIQIMLDSFDALKTAPKEPVAPIEEPDPIDDMVEKMATPLQFFKRKIQEKNGDDHNIIITNADGLDQKAIADGKVSVPGANDEKLNSDESTASDTDTSQSSSESTKGNVMPQTATVKSSSSPAPAVDNSQSKGIASEKAAPEQNTPAVANDVSESRVAETRDSSATTKSVGGTEQLSSEASTFRKILDETSKDTSTTAMDDSNLKALIQTIQTSSPTLPPFALPDFGSVEMGLIGGIIVITSLYLSLAAYLRGVDKDEGYAEWDQYKKKDPDNVDVATKKGVDVNTAMDAAAGAVKDYATTQSTPYGLVNKNQNPFMNTTAAASASTATVKEQTNLRKQSTQLSKPTSEAESLNKVTAQLERLNKLEKDASSVESILAGNIIPSSTGSIEVQKIEEYCEPAKVNPECSESISSYLGAVSEQQVEEGTQKAAAKQIISYLDSLSASSDTKQTSFEGTVPTQANMAMKTGSSQTSAAFSSYLDALSTGSVKEPPSAQAVAGYLEVLSTEAKKSTSLVDSRIIEVEDRLNRLESSVASLPDNIASRLIEWQSRQDQKVNDEIEKIKTYLMDEKISSEDR